MGKISFHVEGERAMPWYVIALLAFGLVFAPFDALYVYIKSERRKDERRRREREKENGQ